MSLERQIRNIQINRLIWDDWNRQHIAEHNVTPLEVEEVCQGDHIDYMSYDGRFQIIGETQQKRLLTVILDPEPEEGEFYPVTAYDASKKARRVYTQEKEKEVSKKL